MQATNVLVSDGTTTYAQDLAAPLSQVLSDGTANYVYGHERLRALHGPWYVGDALGSVRQTLDDAGEVLGSVQYDPWGVPTAGTPQPFGFTGELHRAGQVYLRARWYAPGPGRFVSEDPFAGWSERPYSLHAYQYGYSNPVVFTDPTGTIVCAGVCIGLLVVGGVIILAAVAHEATRSTQMAVDTMPPLDPSALIPMPDAATQARNRADFVRGVAYLRNPGAYVWVTPPMDPGPPDPVGYAGPSLQYPAREDLTVRSPRTGPEEVCVVWPGPSRQASLWPLTTGAPGEQVEASVVLSINTDKRIILGRDQKQYKFWVPQEFVEPWKWQGITNPGSSTEFPGLFNDAAQQAPGIDFHLDGMDLSRVKTAFRTQEEVKGITGKDLEEFKYTNYELYIILTSKRFLQKTTFYREGKQLEGEARDTFFAEMREAGWTPPTSP